MGERAFDLLRRGDQAFGRDDRGRLRTYHVPPGACGGPRRPATSPASVSAPQHETWARRGSPAAPRLGGVPELIEVVTAVGAAPVVVFDLELDVDVHTEPLAGSQEVASTGTGRRRLGLGDEVTFRARHFGLPWRMTSRITSYQAPHRFVDEQIRGPFRTLHHEHVFEDLGNGRTRMIDRMTISTPLGALATRVVLAPYLRRLLERRTAHIKLLAEAPPANPDGRRIGPLGRSAGAVSGAGPGRRGTPARWLGRRRPIPGVPRPSRGLTGRPRSGPPAGWNAGRGS